MRHGPLSPLLLAMILVALSIFGTEQMLTVNASAPVPVPAPVMALTTGDHADHMAQQVLSPAACTPRPRVTVSTRIESGRLRVDVGTTTTSTVGANGIQALRFGTLKNVRVRLQDQSTFTSSRDVQPSATASTYVFYAERLADGSAMVPFTVVDACGDWSTFVGGGPTAVPLAPPPPIGGTPTPTATPRPTQTPIAAPPTSHDSRYWHPPTDHEHGDAPPQWITAAGFTVAFDQHGGFHGNTSPAENTAKHAAMKGFAATMKGVDLYFRVHIASNVLDRMARFHSYEVWARDPSGAVSHWQGWFNTGDPVADRLPRRRGVETDRRPVVLVVDEISKEQGILCEQWYAATASWSWDFGWTVCGSTTVFYPGENDQPAIENWRVTGANGAEARRLEASWYNGTHGRYHPVGRFWTTQFGEGVYGPTDPRCSLTTTRYGVAYQNQCLEQYIAPTMPEVSFPDNVVQKPFGVPGLRLPN